MWFKFHTDLESAQAAFWKAGFYGNGATEGHIFVKKVWICINTYFSYTLTVMCAWIYIKTDITEVFDCESALQLAAQVLDEFDDEEIGVGVLDAKLDKAVAKKLGNA